jgi:ATP/ADP translocase
MITGHTPRTVLLLAAQALWFGIAAALLVIPANGIFLATYGAKWLPLTYVGIAGLGSVASIVIARSLRRWSLSSVSVIVLAWLVATILISSVIVSLFDVAWPSVVLLMLFPILLQLGFVIIGGQAGRLLDLQQIKAHFPRIVSGFVIGFAVGGFAGAPLLDMLGSPQHLAMVAAASLAVFMVLVAITSRRRPNELSFVERQADGTPRPSLRKLLSARFVVLVFTYQVLSAMGSQVLDFLVFDRAAARYQDQEDLTRFVALFTGVLNLVDLVFLALVAGWLLRRFGLRVGLTINPVVVMLFAIGMVLTAFGPGAGSLAMLGIVASARIVDIALSDGATRGSINAVYQVLPVEERVAVQASVEGVGVPLAIGATGVLLLVMNWLDLGTGAIALFAVVLCAAWTVAAFVVYTDYQRALAVRLRRRALDFDSSFEVTDDEQGAARRLLLTDDVRDIRLGLDLAVTADLSSTDLAHLVDHEKPDVRLIALGQLAHRGDQLAAKQAEEETRLLAVSANAFERRAAALSLADLQATDRQALLLALLHDPDPSVRATTLESVGSLDGALVDEVAELLDDPAARSAAHRALERMGVAALSMAAERLAPPKLVRASLLRLVRFVEAAPTEAAPYLARLVEHPDRRVSVAALNAAARTGAPIDPDVLDRLQLQDARDAAFGLAASISLAAADAATTRALGDELELVRERVMALLAARHGVEIIDNARRALDSKDSASRALGIEMLQLLMTRDEAVLAEPIVRTDLTQDDRLRRLANTVTVPARDAAQWLADLVIDPDRRWNDPWLQAVALLAEFQLDRDEAVGHARELSDGADPVLAETIAAVAS